MDVEKGVLILQDCCKHIYPDRISKAEEILSIFIHVMIAIEFIFVLTAS